MRDRWAALGIALTCALAAAAGLMFVESAMGIPWSFWTVTLPLATAAALAIASSPPLETRPWPRPATVAIAATTALLCYAAATARMTIGDLLYFWGPKAVHFFHARAIDVDFLRWPHHYLMHPDYPPLVPLVWAASALVTGDVSYWGAILSTPLFLLAGALSFRGFAAPVIGDRKSAFFAALLLAVTGFACIAGRAAGGAEPFLLLFETVALSALTFGRSRAATTIAAIALAGAVLTKIEGAAFVVAIAGVLILTRRSRTAVAACAPAAALFASWLAFAGHHDLLDGYARAGKTFYPERLGYVLYMTGWQISYRVAYLPWVAALAPLVAAKNFRHAALPLLCAAASIVYTIAFYLTEPEPLLWIQTSAERVMSTTLLCVVVASARASE